MRPGDKVILPRHGTKIKDKSKLYGIIVAVVDDDISIRLHSGDILQRKAQSVAKLIMVPDNWPELYCQT